MKRGNARGTRFVSPDMTAAIIVVSLLLVALFVAGLGSMRGMQATFLAEPVQTLELLALAYAVLLGAQACGTLLFWRCGRSAALTAGLRPGGELWPCRRWSNPPMN